MRKEYWKLLSERELFQCNGGDRKSDGNVLEQFIEFCKRIVGK